MRAITRQLAAARAPELHRRQPAHGTSEKANPPQRGDAKPRVQALSSLDSRVAASDMSASRLSRGCGTSVRTSSPAPRRAGLFGTTDPDPGKSRDGGRDDKGYSMSAQVISVWRPSLSAQRWTWCVLLALLITW